MFNYISFFLNLKRYITEAGHKLDNILIIHAILHSLPCFNIQDIIKQNLLDKGKSFTLDILTVELISVHNYAKHDYSADENKKKAKSNQVVLFTKFMSSSNNPKKKKRKSNTLIKKESLKLNLQVPSVMFVTKQGIRPLSVHLDLIRETHINLENQLTQLLNVYSY